MKSIFPLSKEYLPSKEKLKVEAAIEPNHQQTFQPNAEPRSKYTTDDLAKINQARELIIQITSRVSAQGGIGSNEQTRAPHDLEIAKALNGVISYLDRIIDFI